jgi:transposase
MYLDGYRKEIVAWIGEGLSDRQIAERVRVSPSTVRYWRERNGVLRTPKRKQVPDGTDGPTSAAADQGPR